MLVNTGKNRLFRNGCVVAALIIAGAGLSGCHSHGRHHERDLHTGSIYKFAHSNHPIKVGRGTLAMSISVGRKDTKLTPHKRDELQMFLHYYRDQGAGYLRVEMPRNERARAGLENIVHEMQGEFEKMSIGTESVRVTKYNSRDAFPVIRLSFERHVAHGPDCDGWNQNLADDANNDNSDYWGCATQNNLAAMVANPRDLKGPRGWSPRDARRRDTVYEKHIKGESTGAQRSRDERVDVSGIRD